MKEERGSKSEQHMTSRVQHYHKPEAAGSGEWGIDRRDGRDRRQASPTRRRGGLRGKDYLRYLGSHG